MSTRVRHKVLGMTVALAAITYLDRVCISVTRNEIQRDLGLDLVQMGTVFSAFYVAYAAFEIPTGWWGDTVGSRQVLTRIVSWWSAFTMLTAAAFSFHRWWQSGFCSAPEKPERGPTWRERSPDGFRCRSGAGLKASSSWARTWPVASRRCWSRRCSGPASDGAPSSSCSGPSGSVWAVAWQRWFRDTPAEHPSVSLEERTYIESGRPAPAPHELARTDWRRLLGNRTTRMPVSHVLHADIRRRVLCHVASHVPVRARPVGNDRGPAGRTAADPERDCRYLRRLHDRPR